MHVDVFVVVVFCVRVVVVFGGFCLVLCVFYVVVVLFVCLFCFGFFGFFCLFVVVVVGVFFLGGLVGGFEGCLFLFVCLFLLFCLFVFFVFFNKDLGSVWVFCCCCYCCCLNIIPEVKCGTGYI